MTQIWKNSHISEQKELSENASYSSVKIFPEQKFRIVINIKF